MAYIDDGFITISSGGAIGTGDGSVKSLHHYSTNDTLAVVEGASYFDSAAKYMKAGDTILVTGDVDGTLWTGQYGVKSISASNVVVLTATANKTFTSQMTISANNVPVTDGTYYIGTALVAGTIDLIYTALSAAITTNDAVLTFKINGTAITTGVITIANSGSAGGDSDTCSPSAANTLAVGDVVSVVVSGTPGGSKIVKVDMLVSPT